MKQAGQQRLTIVPMTYKKASEYVGRFHRHNDEPAGCKFAVGVVDEGDALRGVALCGRPVARMLDNGLTLEINRTCTDGCPNANSALYGACKRTAAGMGYRRVMTYTQADETGSSLRAAGFRKVTDLEARASWGESSVKLKNKRHPVGTGGVPRILWEFCFHDDDWTENQMKGQLALATRYGKCESCGNDFWTPAVGRPRKWCDRCEAGNVRRIFIRYLLTSDGEVYSLRDVPGSIKAGDRLADRLNDEGYRKIKLTLPSGRRKDFFVHRLVAMFFLPKPRPEQDQVLHKNRKGDRTDCRSCALEWGTHADNVEDKRKAGTLVQGKRWSVDPKVIKAIRRSKLGAGKLAKKYGLSVSYVRELKNGRKKRA